MGCYDQRHLRLAGDAHPSRGFAAGDSQPDFFYPVGVSAKRVLHPFCQFLLVSGDFDCGYARTLIEPPQMFLAED